MDFFQGFEKSKITIIFQSWIKY